MNQMIDVAELMIVFTGVMVVGWLGMGLFMLLPKKFRDKISYYHEENEKRL